MSETFAVQNNAGPAVRILPATQSDKVLAQTRALVPEAFNFERRILNLIGRNWQDLLSMLMTRIERITPIGRRYHVLPMMYG